jgi:hypothetical protein
MLITSIDKAYEIFNNYRSDKDLALATENVFSALTLRDGFSMSKKMSHIVRTWEMVRGERNKIYATANELLGSITDPTEVTYITNKSNRCGSDWVYSADYDPSKL